MSIDVDKRPVQENGIKELENIGTASNIYVYIVHESCKPTSICDYFNSRLTGYVLVCSGQYPRSRWWLPGK